MNDTNKNFKESSFVNDKEPSILNDKEILRESVYRKDKIIPEEYSPY